MTDNLVREKGWMLKDYYYGIGDSIGGVAVLTGVSATIMITSACVLHNNLNIDPNELSDIGVLAIQPRPLLGPITHVIFCIGLLAIAMNPFVINAMIGDSILADGIGQPSRISDRWPRVFTVGVLLVGMVVAMIVMHAPVKKIDAIVFLNTKQDTLWLTYILTKLYSNMNKQRKHSYL